MVKINDVCPMPKSVDLSDNKGGVVGVSSEFGVIMQKSVSAKADERNTVKGGNEKFAGNDENDVQKDVGTEQGEDNADLIAAMCLNIQDMAQLEQPVQTVEADLQMQSAIVDALDGISDVSSAEITDISPVLTDNQNDIAEIGSEIAGINDNSDSIQLNQNAVQNVDLANEQSNGEMTYSISQQIVNNQSVSAADDGQYSTATQPHDNEAAQNQNVSDIVSDNLPDDIAQRRPVVDMYNRKVYLDGLTEENDAVYDADIANVVSQQNFEPNSADGEIYVKSDDNTTQPIEQIMSADKVNSEKNVDDSADEISALNVNSEAASVYSGFTVNSAESAVPFEKVSQTESVKNQIVSEIYSKFKAGQTDFQIEINPRELGTVTVKMAVKNSELVIELIAHDSKAQNIIISNSNEIKSILQDQLNQNVTVEVIREDNHAAAYDDSQSQHAQPQQQEQEQQKNDDDGNKNFTVDFVTLMQTLNKK